MTALGSKEPVGHEKSGFAEHMHHLLGLKLETTVSLISLLARSVAFERLILSHLVPRLSSVNPLTQPVRKLCSEQLRLLPD
jgi:hypothetical protein